MFNYFCFVLFCFSFVSLYHCVSQLHRISWPMIHSRHIWLSSILMNPHPHHLLWQLQSIFYSTPLYSIDDNCPPFPLPTLCDNDLYRRKSNDPKYQSTKIIFLDRIIIITVEYSRVLDWLFLWLDIHSCRIWLKKKQDFCGFFFFPAVFRTANRTFNGPPIILSQVTTRKFQLWLNRTLRVESGRELSES